MTRFQAATIISRMTRIPIAFGFILGCVAVGAAVKGLGVPNHPYQVGLAIGTICLAYHRRWLPKPKNPFDVALIPVNTLLIAVLFKLFIGGGIRTPFAWLKVPNLSTTAPTWLSFLPQVGVSWQAVPLTEWKVDLTLFQSFLLLVTIAAGWVRFQPFASITALLLCLVSLPAYADFEWNWLLPAVAISFASFYVQAHSVAAGAARSRA